MTTTSHYAAPTRPSRTRRPAPLLRVVAAGLLTALLAVGTLPDLLFGLDQRTPFTQLVAFRPLILLGLLALGVVLLVVTALRRWAWPFAVGVLAVLAVGAALVLPRAVADPLPITGTPLKVLTFNVLQGSADVDALADLIRTERPDLVSLPEAGKRYQARLAPLVEPLGYRLEVTRTDSSHEARNLVVLIADRLGDVTTTVGDETALSPYLQVTGGSLGELRFVAYHSAAPLRGSVPAWRADLALLPKWCAGPTPAILAGDFNATLDHSALRAGMAGCVDAADQRGAGLVPTWGPSARQRSIGPQIDHVLGTGGIAAETFEVLDLPGSDHRAIVTTLRVPA